MPACHRHTSFLPLLITWFLSVLQSSDVIFAKTFKGDVMLTIIWYGRESSFFVTLTPAGNEEQALVDTLFPHIYGKRRGVSLALYEPPPGVALGRRFTPADEDAAVAWAAAHLDVSGSLALAGAGAAGDGKADEDAAPPAWKLFTKLSLFEASEPVPDPDEVRARDEAEAEEDAKTEEDEDEGEEDSKADEAIVNVSGGAGGKGATFDVSGGNGYTQVYVVMSPAPGTAGLALVPRNAMFRFGSWVYAGVVEFPVDSLRLGDVPYVLPALQKQQGRLAYISEATAFPAAHPLAPVIGSFMAAVSLLQSEMEDSQDEVAALAQQAVNAWIDADWAASFFELAFSPGSVPPGLAGTEVIAAKIYLHQGTGVILHCVWFGSSLYCVLADSVEDLPLLDVAFPDVTARNRVVQVRTYSEVSARKLAAAHTSSSGAAAGAGSCPLPSRLCVWEGRRRGVPGVGFGAASAMSANDASAAAEAIRAKARARAQAEAEAAAAAERAAGQPKQASPVGKGSPAAAAAGPVASSAAAPTGLASDSKVPERAAAASRPVVSSAPAVADDDDNEDLYDVSGLKMSLTAAAGSAASKPAGGAAPNGSSAAAASSGNRAGVAASTSSTALSPTSGATVTVTGGAARAPHHVAPMNRGGPAPASLGGGAGGARGGAGAVAAASVDDDGGRNRLIRVGAKPLDGAASNSKDEDAPWDATGRPRNLPRLAGQ